MAGLAGGWQIAEMEACNLPEKLATGFSEVVSGLVGATYVPVLFCGTQIVNGTNYMLICKQTLVTREPQEHLVQMVLHEDIPTGGIIGAFRIMSIETII